MSDKDVGINIEKHLLYNPEQKTIYLESIDSLDNQRRAYAALKRYCPYEKLLGKDLCEFSYQDAVDTTGIVSTQLYGKTKCVREAVHYVDWCIASGIAKTKDDPFARLHTNSMSEQAIRTTYFKDAAHVLEWMDSVFICEDRMYYMMVRCTLWCVWMGLTDDEIMDIPIKSVEFQTLEAKGKRYSIPDEAWSDFVTLRSTTEFSASRTIHREKPDMLICRMNGNQRTFWDWLGKNVIKARRETSDTMQVTKRTINTSGKFYRTWIEEKSGNLTVSMKTAFQELTYTNRYLYIDAYNVWKKTYYES